MHTVRVRSQGRWGTDDCRCWDATEGRRETGRINRCARCDLRGEMERVNEDEEGREEGKAKSAL